MHCGACSGSRRVIGGVAAETGPPKDNRHNHPLISVRNDGNPAHAAPAPVTGAAVTALMKDFAIKDSATKIDGVLP